MNKEFFDALELLEKEKGIPKEYMMEKVEAALVSAFKREHAGNSNVRVVLNADKKDVRVYEYRTVVEEVTNPETEISLEDAHELKKKYKLGDEVENELKTKTFGRISAQTAKQVIIQGIREAERDKQIRAYEDKKAEIISATVERLDPTSGNVVINTGTGYATLIKTEQIPGESFFVGQHIKVYVIEVRKEARGPLVTLSRTHPGMVKRLFELEVPEIQDGTVVIENITREAGSRSKMAVYSRDENVDPIGACVGNRGIRINGIVEELNGERIDIVKYSENPEEFIRAALSPATVNDVIIEGERSARVIVSEDQLSLAIGKEGQNARLAARLTGYKIDIKTA